MKLNTKELLANNVPPNMALTGRIKNWLEDDEKRLPVSCTVFKVDSNLEGLFEALRFTSHGLRNAAGVALDFSEFNEEEVPTEKENPGHLTITLSEDHPEGEEFAKLENTDLVSYEFGKKSLPGVVTETFQHKVGDFDLISMFVEDSMEGDYGIEDSWYVASKAIILGQDIRIDLSKLRAAGTTNDKGLVASGVMSFVKFYQQLATIFTTEDCFEDVLKLFSLVNQELRRGGIYKNGAITTYLATSSKHLLEFLTLPNGDTPWIKRQVYLDTDFKNLLKPIRKLIVNKVNNGTLWLAKPQYDKEGNRLYSNVCGEILIPSRGTCLISHVNLGQITAPQQLIPSFMEAAEWLCQLHPLTNINYNGYYLSPESDKQVGLGVIGLANMLAIAGIPYSRFVDTMEAKLAGEPLVGSITYDWVNALYDAMKAASDVGKEYGMERLFTVAPTASCSYQYEDAEGYTTAPEISPPLDFEVDRDSGTFGVQTYEYNPATEIAVNVGWDTQWRLLKAWQGFMDATGLAHSISSNLWSQQTITEDWIVDEFIPSPLVTTYYRITVDNEALDKSEIVSIESDESKFRDLYDTSSTQSCGLRRPEDDANYCSSCGG